jgi:hypothetical protein
MATASRDAASTTAVTSGGPRVRRAPGFDSIFTGIFALFGWGVGLVRLSDNSFFWHLVTGRLILDEGIPHHDPFSFTAPGAKWVAQSWLAELLYGGLDRIFGPFGIRVLGGLVGAAIGVLAFRLALRLAGDRIPAALLTAAALTGLYTLWSERPLLIGVMFLLVLLWVVEVPDSWVGRRPLVVLPMLFWLWTNVHGTFALGFVYLGLHLVGRWLEGARPWEGRERRLATGGLLAFAVTFANPYGIDLVKFPIDLVARGDVLSRVIEWESPDFHEISGMALGLWLVVFVAVIARGARRPTVRDLVVTLPFLLLALWALRNVAIAPLIGLPVAARLLAAKPRPSTMAPRLGWLVAALMAFFAVGFAVGTAAQPDYAFGGYPVRAMRAVEREGLLGRNLLADDADGGYLILEYWPDQKVFFDDRYDMYPRRVIKDFLRVNDGRPGWRRVLDRHDVDVIVWNRDAPLVELVEQTGEWERVYRDKRFVVLSRDS